MNRNSPFATTALNFYADGNVRAREHVGNTPASSFLARLPSKSGNQSGLRDALRCVNQHHLGVPAGNKRRPNKLFNRRRSH
jgi:hypothetical protein